MKILYFDIETVPTDKALQENGLLDEQLKLDEAEIIKKLSLSAVTAKIICLCYAFEPSVSGTIEVLQGDETEIIKGFWKIVPDCNLFVGHNILDFDMRFLYQRSVILQIKPSRDIPLRPLPQCADLRHHARVEQVGPRARQPRYSIESPRHPVAKRKTRRRQSLPLLPRRQTLRDRRVLQTRRRLGTAAV
jgi:hypothetical protein